MHTLANPPSDPALAEWVARRIIAQHVDTDDRTREARGCAQCPPAGDTCAMLASASSYLRKRDDR